MRRAQALLAGPLIAVLVFGGFAGLEDTDSRGLTRATAPTRAAGAQEGEALARSLGCGACHEGITGAESIQAQSPSLGSGSELAADFVYAYLADPSTRRPEIAPARMPDFRLGDQERLALALYLGRTGSDGPELADARGRNPDATAEHGRALFVSLGCGACHGSPDEASAPGGAAIGPDLGTEGDRVRATWLQTWLRDPVPIRPVGSPLAPDARMPDFGLSDTEAGDLVAYLEGRTSIGRPAWTPEALTPLRRDRAQRLLETRFACVGCHRIGESGGQLAPPLAAVADRLQPTFVRDMIADPRRAAPGSAMPRQRMRTEDAELIASYLLEGEGAWTAAERVPADARIALVDPRETGAGLYARYCAACHGAEGAGDGWNARNLPLPPTRHADGALMGRRADDTLFDGIYGGGWVLDVSARMPAFGDFLSAAEIRAIIAHIRVLCDCQGPTWSNHGG